MRIGYLEWGKSGVGTMFLGKSDGIEDTEASEELIGSGDVEVEGMALT